MNATTPLSVQGAVAARVPAPSDPGPTSAPVARRFFGSSPALYRLASLVTVGALTLTALLGFLAAGALVDATDRAQQNTGPVLVATQDVFASIAEADAASAAVFLSGTDEDREQRRLYELALERSTAQLEEVSRLVGDDTEAHDSIKSIAADLTSYSGLVEGARLANVEGVADATGRLQQAIAVVQDGIVPEVQAITEGAQAQLDDNVKSGRTSVVVALLVAFGALAVLVAAQTWISRRTKRLVNLPLAGATALMVVSVAWLLTAWVRQQDDLDVAREGGYDSIALTAEIQTTAFRYKTLESLALLGAGDPGEQAELARRVAAIDVGTDEIVAGARSGEAEGSGLLLAANRTADSTHEQAATAEMMLRWQRYLDTSLDIQTALDAGEADGAADLAIGPGSADFNGFNTSVESVLSDNRTQFTGGLSRARDRLDWLQLAMIILPGGAAALSLWGYQLRISEYRR